MNKKFYVTNAIPYVNAAPHIGHALEFVQSDVIARYHKLLNEAVCFLCGSDENALKNVQAAEVAGEPVEKFVDTNAQRFEDLAEALQVKFDVFQKGSDTAKHFPASQKLWTLCEKNGDIYKKEYEGLYCVGCESFYTADELDKNGECYEHPGKKLEKVKEINYFFKLSRYQRDIQKLLSLDILKIYPESRKNEILSFLKEPLHDISISRSNERAKNWGVPVPGDETQRMYVWFDALNIYQSGIGFGWDEKNYSKWWPADVHVIGKGITRFHAVYWPAFLLSAKLPLPKSLFIHGYVTIDGQKMSKSLGNVLDPFDLIKKWSADAVRYYLLREITPFGDGDFSDSRMKEVYESDLANELGNLILRVTTLAQKDGLTIEKKATVSLDAEYINYLNKFEFSKALENTWSKIKNLNKKIDTVAPWKKTAGEREQFLLDSFDELQIIATHLKPFLPEAATKIFAATTGKIAKTEALFPKI